MRKATHCKASLRALPSESCDFPTRRRGCSGSSRQTRMADAVPMFLVEFPSSMRRLSRSFLWWLAGASLLLAVQREGRAQEPSRTSTIEGVVRDSSGTPVKGAGVTVEREGITSGATVYTGENGFYRLPSVAAGKVAVQAEREGFLRATSAPFEVAPGETRTLDLTLASPCSAILRRAQLHGGGSGRHRQPGRSRVRYRLADGAGTGEGGDPEFQVVLRRLSPFGAG